MPGNLSAYWSSGRFLNSSSDARLLQPLLEAASAPDITTPPSDEDMESDADRYDMRPLFDGGELERI